MAISTGRIEGWQKAVRSFETDEIDEMISVGTWLHESMPEQQQASLIHNDFKYDNLVLDSNLWSNVIGVLDWEMATLGDPLMDLGTTLGYWIEASDPPVMQQLRLSPTMLSGNPSRRELAEWYAAARGIKLNNLVFYYVYGLFKIAVIVQQIYFRYKQGYTPTTDDLPI